MARHNPDQRCTPVAEWPPADRKAWDTALEPADPFEPTSGYAHRWKASTRGGIENGYGRWLGWLDRTGQLDPESDPGDRATRERVTAYLAYLREVRMADNTLAGRLQQLGNALRAMDQSRDWGWIHTASSRFYSKAKLVRDPVERMQPPEAVIALGYDLMQEAEEGRFRTPCDRATLFRDGLLLALLVQRPLRLANLAALEIDRHLVRVGDGWRIFVHPDETKGGEAVECAWPDGLASALETYLRVHRAELLTGATSPKPMSALWISRQGKAMCSSAISFQISARTKEEFGQPINPHTFRHMAATAIASESPESVTDIKSVLGHASLSTGEKHYNRAKTIGAGSRYQQTVHDLRARK